MSESAGSLTQAQHRKQDKIVLKADEGHEEGPRRRRRCRRRPCAWIRSAIATLRRRQ